MTIKNEINKIIETNGVVFVNDLVDYFNTNNLVDIINKLHEMKINNKMIKVKVYCKECGKEMIVRPSIYKKQKYFHCEEHMSHRPSGKNSPFYKRIEVKCTNCGKLFSVAPYDYNKMNSFGDNHNFCCQECYWEYRSKYYIDDKHHMFGTHQSEENKRRQKELIVNMIADGKMPQTMSTPHKKIYDLLLRHHVSVENEYPVKYHSIDIFLIEYNLMIEIMGDYWHATPLKYNINNLTKQQKKSIKQDKSKHTYIKKYENIEILYLWETDINKNIDLCWSLIDKYINNNGVLDNYHSFNYHLEDNNDLKLNDTLITPIQEIETKDKCA